MFILKIITLYVWGTGIAGIQTVGEFNTLEACNKQGAQIISSMGWNAKYYKHICTDKR